MKFEHEPVLLEECLQGLEIRPGGTYVDGTLGGAGHSREILRHLDDEGLLIGIDRDENAILAATERLKALQQGAKPSFKVRRGNFHDVKILLGEIGISAIDGMLLDLGVSSHQLDERERGFSYHDDAPLDMRMDRSQSFSAKELVNSWDVREIGRVLRDYGEEKWAVQIARVIVDRRKRQPIETTAQLVDIIDAAIPKKVRAKDGSHPARRSFQALRIAVNDELAPLNNALEDAVSLLKPGGRLCVIAFHSLEDRIVKNCFRRLANPCECPPGFPVCVCGKKAQIKQITRKPITASAEELERNPRARSATLRIAEKLAVER